MCLIVFDWNPTRRSYYPSFVVAANRDEVYDRPSQIAHFWKDKKPTIIYGGRDLLMGGTWLACSTTTTSGSGRFAAVTNYHEPRKNAIGGKGKIYPRSRGEIPVMFVSEEEQQTQQQQEQQQPSPKVNSTLTATTTTTLSETASSSSLIEFVKTRLEICHKEYGGYNAILFDGQSLIYCTNRGGGGEGEGERRNGGGEEEQQQEQDQQNYSFVMKELPPGLYGLSNHLLDTPWPKVIKAKIGLSNVLSSMSSMVQDGVTKEEEEDDDDEKNTNNTMSYDCYNYYHTQIAQKLIKVMEDTTKVFDTDLLPTTLGVQEEIIRSSIFVEGPTFGTRTTTIVTYYDNKRYDGHGGCSFFDMTEKNHIIHHHHHHHHQTVLHCSSSEEEEEEESSSPLVHHQRIEIRSSSSSSSDPRRRHCRLHRDDDDGFNNEQKLRI